MMGRRPAVFRRLDRDAAAVVKPIPEHAGASRAVLAAVLADRSGATGIYYDETGATMTGSIEAEDFQFQNLVVAVKPAFFASDIG
jgi:hypothetical protein